MDKAAQAADVFSRHASLYASRYMDVSRYTGSFDLFCRLVATQQARVLEVGCGPGNISRYLLQQRPDFRLLGIDLAPNMLELARQHCPQAEFRLLDARQIRLLDRPFDAVLCGFVLPYLSREEARQLIADAAALLAPGGVLYLSTMEGSYSKSGWQSSSSGDTLYIYYHEAAYLTRALSRSGFGIYNLQREQYAAEGGAKTTDLIILAGKR